MNLTSYLTIAKPLVIFPWTMFFAMLITDPHVANAASYVTCTGTRQKMGLCNIGLSSALQSK